MMSTHRLRICLPVVALWLQAAHTLMLHVHEVGAVAPRVSLIQFTNGTVSDEHVLRFEPQRSGNVKRSSA